MSSSTPASMPDLQAWPDDPPTELAVPVIRLEALPNSELAPVVQAQPAGELRTSSGARVLSVNPYPPISPVLVPVIPDPVRLHVEPPQTGPAPDLYELQRSARQNFLRDAPDVMFPASLSSFDTQD